MIYPNSTLASLAHQIAEVRELCKVPGQDGPLGQRLALLESLIAESEANKDLRGKGAGLAECCVPGSMVVVDLTDPLLARDEANGIFQVLTEQFRSLPLRCGKLLALDEVSNSFSFSFYLSFCFSRRLIYPNTQSNQSINQSINQ